jgi:PKD repeat protein
LAILAAVLAEVHPLHAGSPPVNDLFAARSVLSGPSVVVSTYNTYATTEPDEPSLGDRIASRSLWWTWTAPYTGTANFSTFGSDGPLALGIFVGDSLPSLSTVGISNVTPWTLRYYSSYPYRSSFQPMRGDTVNVPVRSGETYQILVAAPVFASDAKGGSDHVVLGINQPPAILSNGTVSGVLAQSLSYQISASHTPTEYNAQGLPPGLSLDAYTGLIGGTPTAVGTFDATISATNPGGVGSATVRFEIAAADSTARAPELAYGYAFVDGTVGASLSYSSINARNTPTEFTADPLPTGVTWQVSSLGSATAYAYPTGTPTQAGIFKSTVRATNAAGSAEAYLTLRIREKPPVPVLQSAAAAYGKVGASFYYSLYATDMTGGTYEIGELPAGLQMSASGYISGTPTTAGTFEVPVKVTNATGSTSATLTLVISPAADAPGAVKVPVITSAGGASGNVGTPFSYKVNANTPGAQYTASGLPEGLTINPTTGAISGLPTASGSYTVTITASNELGTSTSPLTLSIGTPDTPFAFISPAMAKGVTGKSFNYSLLFRSFSDPYFYIYPSSLIRTTVDASALPPGLSYVPNPSSYPGYYYLPLGSISGTPTVPGIYHVPISTIYQNVTTQGTLTIVVSASSTQAPVITSPASAQGNVGQSFSYSTKASNYAGNFTANGLPAGLSIDASKGTISGTPTTSGTYAVDLAATNAAGTGHARLTISIGATPTGTFYNSAVVEGTVGQSLSTYVGYSNPVSGTVTYSATGLPDGLQMSSSGAISGTPTSAGTYPTTFSATNAGGTTSIVRTFLIHAALNPPVLTSDLMAKGNLGASFYYSVYTSGDVATYEFGKLPPGLTASGNTISGTPTQTGTYEISIKATNAGGSTTGILTVRIDPLVPPTISVTASMLALRGESFSKWFYASNAASYSLSGSLPAGITFDAQNFRLTGTPTQNGAFPLEITATGPGGTITVPFTLFVAPPPLPVITSSLVANFSSSNYTYLYASNNPTAFSAQGLPAGLIFYNNSSSASVADNGSFSSSALIPATITASNFTGSSSAIVHFTYNPYLSSATFGAAMAEGVVNQSLSYTLYSGSSSLMTSRVYSATNLPPGLAIDAATGKITGTPTTAGTYAVNITANHSSYAPLNLTLTIRVKAPELPVITSNSTITATVGQSLYTWIDTSGNVTSYALDPLPPGLIFDSTTGNLTGTPTAAGTYKVQASATNSAGTRTAGLLIQVASAPPPAIFYSDLSLRGIVGESFSEYLSASNTTSYAAIGLPPGITLDASNGKLSGTPTTPGSYLVEVHATNAGGTTTAKVAFDVLAQQIPVISSDAEEIGAVGDSFSYTITASHAPGSFTAANLPPGLSLDFTTGQITGTPTQAGDYLVPVTASNAAGVGPATLTLRIQPRKPGWLTSPTAATGVVGENMSIPLSTSLSGSAISAEDLPSGLSLPAGSTTISGIPTTAGDSEISVHVKRGETETTAVLSLHIDATPTAPPFIDSPLTAFVGGGFSDKIKVSNLPTSLEVANLPAGLALDPATGAISGTPRTSGVADITISAANAVGESTVIVKLVTIAPPTSVVTTSANIYATASEAFAYPIALSTETYNPQYYPPYSFASRPSVLPPTITARGLPPGMFFNPETQRIEGTAAEPGDYTVEFTVSTALSETTTRITLHVSASPSAASSALQVSGLDLNSFGAVGSPFSLNVFPIGLATELTSTELPPGLALSKETGVSNGIRTLFGKITGSPTKPGVYPVKFTFSNAEQTAIATVTIVIPDTPEPPSFSGYLAAAGTVGKSFSYYIGDGSGYLLNNAASISTITGLPPGLSFDQTSHRITGTPTTAGRYVVPISLTNAGGTTDAKVVVTIADATFSALRLGSSGDGLTAGEIGYTDENFALTLAPADSEITDLTSSGLPAGLELQRTNSGAWILTGTPTETGTFHLLLTAASAQGNPTAPLTLDIRHLDQSTPQPPPDPTPTPTPIPPATEPPPLEIIINKPRHIETAGSSVAIRGRILGDLRRGRAKVRIGTDIRWKRIRVSRNGHFKLHIKNLPLGTTKVFIRTRDSSDRMRTLRIRIHRSEPPPAFAFNPRSYF